MVVLSRRGRVLEVPKAYLMFFAGRAGMSGGLRPEVMDELGAVSR